MNTEATKLLPPVWVQCTVVAPLMTIVAESGGQFVAVGLRKKPAGKTEGSGVLIVGIDDRVGDAVGHQLSKDRREVRRVVVSIFGLRLSL